MSDELTTAPVTTEEMLARVLGNIPGMNDRRITGDEVEYHKGSKIILPERMTFRRAYDVLKRLEKEAEEPTSFSRTFNYRPDDGAHAAYQVVKQKWGMGLGKVLDMGFFETFDRPFNPIADGSDTGIGIETLRDSIGRTEANLLVAGAIVLGVALLAVTTLALLRLLRVAAGHRRISLPTVATLGLVWGLCWVFGAQAVSGAPIASTPSSSLSTSDSTKSRSWIIRSMITDTSVPRGLNGAMRMHSI